MGRDVEGMASDLGRWMNGIQDVKAGHKKQVNKKRMFGSVEEEALETWAAKKKAEAMEKELRDFIVWNYGLNAWQEIIRLQVKLRKEERARKLQAQKDREELMIAVGVILGIVVVGAITIGVFYLIYR